MGNFKTCFRKLAKETKDPINISEKLKSTTEVIKRLPEFPKLWIKLIKL